jgi:anti-sigma B factor antagonist
VTATDALTSDAAPPAAVRSVFRSLRNDGLRVGVVDEPGSRRVFVDGEIDVETAPLLRAALACSPGPICLDLSGVDFCDVTGINLILDADRLLREAGHLLVLVGVPPQLRHLLRVLCLDDDLTIEIGELPARPVQVGLAPVDGDTDEVERPADDLPPLRRSS